MNSIKSLVFRYFLSLTFLKLNESLESSLAGPVVPMRYSGVMTSGMHRTSPISLALASWMGRA